MSHWMRCGALFVAALAIFGCSGEGNTTANTTEPTTDKKEPVVIELELFPKKAPKTVERIVALIEEGFYNDQRFHRVIEGATQWGSPLSRTMDLRDQQVGGGGTGKALLPFETNDLQFEVGVLAMASTGSKVGGDCQMFIMNSAAPPGLAEQWQGNYAAFGKVTKNMEAVDKVQVGDSLKMKVLEKSPDTVKVEITVVPYS